MGGPYEAFFTELNNRSLEVLNRILGVLTYTSEKISDIHNSMEEVIAIANTLGTSLDQLGEKLDGIQGAADEMLRGMNNATEESLISEVASIKDDVSSVRYNIEDLKNTIERIDDNVASIQSS